MVFGATGFVGGGWGNFRVDDQWVRFERDLQAEVDRLFPGEQLVRVCGLRFILPGTQTMQIKDIKFSNSITVEHNTLGGGAIGHIVRNRRVAPDTAVLEDRWFHYDQVGSVLSESDAIGNLVATHYQDAFGVRQADWETGLPGGVGEGWAHNTKELDGGTGLMYMYQRHYLPEHGMFMSRAPYEVIYEEEYVFAGGNPVMFVDPDGEIRIKTIIYALGTRGLPYIVTLAMGVHNASIGTFNKMSRAALKHNETTQNVINHGANSRRQGRRGSGSGGGSGPGGPDDWDNDPPPGWDPNGTGTGFGAAGACLFVGLPDVNFGLLEWIPLVGDALDLALYGGNAIMNTAVRPVRAAPAPPPGSPLPGNWGSYWNSNISKWSWLTGQILRAKSEEEAKS